MIRILEIEKIRIANLFSYYAEDGSPIELDLSGCDPEKRKNIVIIGGRNGLGKTSLLNSIRLLFYGPSAHVRRAALRVKTGLEDRDAHSGAVLPEHTFLLGVPGEWDGLFNTIARNERQQDYFIEMRWREQGGTVTARRSWLLQGDKYDERLSIEGPSSKDRISTIEEGKAFLAQRLPEHFSGFYLFDGEDLQFLANSLFQETGSERVLKEMLGISRVEVLRDVLEEIGRSLPRRARVNATEEELDKFRYKKREQERELNELKQTEQEAKLELVTVQGRLSEVRNTLFTLRARGFGVQGARELEREIDVLGQELSRFAESLGRELNPLAPLLCRPDLAEAALQRIRSLLERPDLSTARILQELKEVLPSAMAAPPHPVPPLTKAQVEFYQARLRNKLLEYTITLQPVDPAPVFHGLTSDRLRNLAERLAPYSSSSEVHREWRRRLMEAADNKARLGLLRERQRKTGDIPADAQEQFESLVREEETLQRKQDELQIRLSGFPSQRKALEQSISQWKGQIDKLEEQLRERQETHERGNLAKELATGFFRQYQLMLQRTIVADLARDSTGHWQELMESHKLVAGFDVEPNLRVRLRTESGEYVGAQSISEGMKQLAATSFVWALSEITGSRMPVIVDTPLGRVDLGHQKKLLTHYFPNAARQVIIFPTDSELDIEKHRLLRKHVYREYRLVNPSGRNAHIENGSLWR